MTVGDPANPLQPATDAADLDRARWETRRQVSGITSQLADDLPMWIVFGPGTRDQPGAYVARLWLCRPETRTGYLLRAASLGELRSLLPPWMTRLPRQPEDDPNIIETWL